MVEVDPGGLQSVNHRGECNIDVLCRPWCDYAYCWSYGKYRVRACDAADYEIHEGYFPETIKGLENEIFALVNMDADLYNPTIAGLEFFYPRLSPGGVMLVHDYNPKWEGVMKAVDEFSRKIPESVISLPDMDGTVMIIKNKTVNPDAGTRI